MKHWIPKLLALGFAAAVASCGGNRAPALEDAPSKARIDVIYFRPKSHAGCYPSDSWIGAARAELGKDARFVEQEWSAGSPAARELAVSAAPMVVIVRNTTAVARAIPKSKDQVVALVRKHQYR